MTDPVLLTSLASYVPRFIKQRLLHKPAPLTSPKTETFSGAILFADISGFTELAERLARKSATGAEELSYLLNVYMEEVVDLVILQGGDIIKFAGDALVALWATGEAEEDLATATHRAVQCSLLIQAILHDQQPLEDVRLSLRMGIGAGEVTASHLGGQLKRWEILIAGPPLAQMGRAEKQAQPGQVILSPEAWALIQGQGVGRRLPDGGVRIEDLRAPLPFRPNPPLNIPAAAQAALRNYIPGAILHRLAAQQSDWLAEIRRVTVLFINLPDFDHTTPIDQAQQVINTLQQDLYRYEGSINKLSADDKGASLLVALGLPPLSHEDDTRRGVQVALAMQRTLRRLEVRASIGVATERAFCGVVGSKRRREYTMIGDVVNLASRLMQAGPSCLPETTPILCDQLTYQATQDDIEYQILAPIVVKGKTDPVAIFSPIRIRERMAYPELETDQAESLIGRAAERAFLQQAVRDLAAGGDGQVVIIEGEAGIGKSRLAEELFRQSRKAGLNCIISYGDTIEKSTPYFAWRSIFNHLLGLNHFSDPDVRRRYALIRLRNHLGAQILPLAPLFNDVLPLDLPDNDRTRTLTGQTRAEYTRDLLVRLLDRSGIRPAPDIPWDRRPTWSGPLVLILEDTHWLDSASWALTLAIQQRVKPLLLVLTQRATIESPSSEFNQLKKLAGPGHLVLDALAPREAVQLVCRRLGVSNLPQAVARLIFDKAEGHPFFSEELAYSLRDAGLLVIRNGRCRLAPKSGDLESLDFPHTIRSVITSRIDRLTAEQQLILKVASVIGRVFAYRTLQEIYPVEADRQRLPQELTALEKLDIMPLKTPDSDISYIFKHLITQEVAYNLMLVSQRRQLHRAVAEWYETNYGDDLSSLYPLLAHHWSRAISEPPGEANRHQVEPELVEKSVTYLIRASEQALRSYANQEAISFFKQALNLLNLLPPTTGRQQQRLTLLIALGNPSIAVKGFASPEVQEIYQEARQLCAQLAASREHFFVLQGLLGLYFNRSKLSTALEIAQQLLILGQKLDDPFLIMKGHYGLGHTLVMMGRFAEAHPALEQAVALYDPVAYPARRQSYQYMGVDPGVGAQGYAAFTLWLLGYPEQAQAMIEAALALAHQLAEPVSQALISAFAAVFYQLCGMVEQTQTWSEALLNLSNQRGFAFWTAWGKVLQGWVQGQHGDYVSGIEQLREGLADHRATGAALYRPYFLALQADTYRLAGQTRTGLNLINGALASIKSTGERFYEAELHRLRGTLLRQQAAEQGDAQTAIAAAEAAFKRALRVARAQQARSLELRAAISLAQLWQVHNPQAARNLLQPLYNQFNEGFTQPDLSEAKTLLAKL